MILYFGITMIIAVCIYYTVGIKEREGLKNNPDQDNIDNYEARKCLIRRYRRIGL